MNPGNLPKSVGRTFVRSVAKSEALWSLLGKPVSRIGESFSYWRDYELKERQAIKSIGTSEVLHGPFRGLKYPVFKSAGSALYAKLLGSYESELHPAIERMRGRGYTEIVDVGCAEGYYAVGFAVMFPGAEVHAFDIDPQARMLCQKMARANGVMQQVHVGAECTRDYLASFPVKHRGLVVSDCEGWEKNLFDETVAAHLRNCDLIIEVHDLIDPEISGLLTKAFAKTHRIDVVKSIPDKVKAAACDYPQMADLTEDVRLGLMGEGRHDDMEWFVCASMASNPVL
jgi:precorrin-6B methylase 2